MEVGNALELAMLPRGDMKPERFNDDLLSLDKNGAPFSRLHGVPSLILTLAGGEYMAIGFANDPVDATHFVSASLTGRECLESIDAVRFAPRGIND